MSEPWVKTALVPRLGPLPCWVVLPWPAALFNFNTLWITIVVLVLLAGVYLTSKGRTLLWVTRRMRTSLRGQRMITRPLGYRRAMFTDVQIADFDFESWRKL